MPAAPAAVQRRRARPMGRLRYSSETSGESGKGIYTTVQVYTKFIRSYRRVAQVVLPCRTGTPFRAERSHAPNPDQKPRTFPARRQAHAARRRLQFPLLGGGAHDLREIR